MNQFLSQLIGIKRVKAHTAAGTSTITSDSVDLQSEGADAVLFLTSFGTPAADNILKAQQSADAFAADTADITGGAVVPGASDDTEFSDIISPSKRYTRASCARGTSSTLETIYALLYRKRELPVNNTVSGTIAGVTVNQPA